MSRGVTVRVLTAGGVEVWTEWLGHGRVLWTVDVLPATSWQ